MFPLRGDSKDASLSVLFDIIKGPFYIQALALALRQFTSKGLMRSRDPAKMKTFQKQQKSHRTLHIYKTNLIKKPPDGFKFLASFFALPVF